METLFEQYANTEAIDAVNEGRSVPRKIGDFKIKYIPTDGWRGYYDAVATKKSNWKKLDSSWVTGDWDDAPHGHASKDVTSSLDKLYLRVKELGGEMCVVYVPTSNVFSTAYDVFVRGIDTNDL